MESVTNPVYLVDLCSYLTAGTRVRVLSSVDGKMLIQDAMRPSHRYRFGGLLVRNIKAFVDVNPRDPGQARASLTCVANPQAYHEIKEQTK